MKSYGFENLKGWQVLLIILILLPFFYGMYVAGRWMNWKFSYEEKTMELIEEYCKCK